MTNLDRAERWIQFRRDSYTDFAAFRDETDCVNWANFGIVSIERVEDPMGVSPYLLVTVEEAAPGISPRLQMLIEEWIRRHVAWASLAGANFELPIYVDGAW